MNYLDFCEELFDKLTQDIRKIYENSPQWKKDALDNWTEDLKKSCTYWEDREY